MNETSSVKMSPLVDDAKKDYVNLTEDQKKYMAFLRMRLIAAKNMRDRSHDEFDGMTYCQAYDDNLKGANSYIMPAKNPEDSTFVTGTTRQALLVLVARVNSFNFTTEIVPYDYDDRAMAPLGHALEMVVRSMKDADGDDAKRLLRFYELFSQGDVFAMQEWVEEFRMEKTKVNFDGVFTGVNWTSRLKKVFEGCRRRVIPGRRMYLGSMFVDSFRDQPYVFEWDRMPYADAMQIFGTWENWKYVKTGKFDCSPETQGTYMENWWLNETPDGEVEIIRYYDRFANEFQIIVNGTPMLPIGFPMPWEHGEYPVVQGGFEPMRSGFAYHNSIVRRLRNGQLQENEVWRMLILMLQKSVFRPMANMTGRQLTRRVLYPGKITFGLDKTKFLPIDDGSPQVTSGMLEMANRIRGNMDDNSIPEIKRGQMPGDRTTATTTMQVQKEADIVMSLSVNAAQMLEQELDYLMVSDIVQNAIRPGYVKSTKTESESGLIDAVVEVLSGKPEPMSDEQRMEKSYDILKSEHEGKIKVSRRMKIYADVKNVIGRISVRSVPRPKPSSAAEKISFDEMFNRAATMFSQTLDMKFWQDEFSRVWGMNPDKAFKRDVMEMTGMGTEPMRSEQGKETAAAAMGVNAMPEMSKPV